MWPIGRHSYSSSVFMVNCNLSLPTQFHLGSGIYFVLVLEITLVWDKSHVWKFTEIAPKVASTERKVAGQLNSLIYLQAKNFKILQQWRIKQEKKLWLHSKKKKNLKIMSKGDVINFMQTYQRITQNMFKDAPKYASIIFKLDSKHQINSAIYKKKWEIY